MTQKNNNFSKINSFYQAKKDFISPTFLISPKYLRQTKSTLSGQNLDIWFCSKKGRFEVEGGEYPAQTISTKVLKERLINRITDSLHEVNSWTSLKIQRTLSEPEADIKFILIAQLI